MENDTVAVTAFVVMTWWAAAATMLLVGVLLLFRMMLNRRWLVPNMNSPEGRAMVHAGGVSDQRMEHEGSALRAALPLEVFQLLERSMPAAPVIRLLLEMKAIGVLDFDEMAPAGNDEQPVLLPRVSIAGSCGDSLVDLEEAITDVLGYMQPDALDALVEIDLLGHEREGGEDGAE